MAEFEHKYFKKTSYMRTGPRHHVICCDTLTSSGLALPFF